MKFKVKSIYDREVKDTWLINTLYNRSGTLIGVCVNNSGNIFEVDHKDIRLQTIEEYYL